MQVFLLKLSKYFIPLIRSKGLSLELKLFNKKQMISLQVIDFQYLPAGRQASANFVSPECFRDKKNGASS